MRADELARRVASALDGGYDFVLVNFCNADMIAHTGNEAAAIKACEALDDALSILWKKIQRVHGTLIITADHGNVEQMHAPHGGVDTEHNPNPVPFLAAGASVSSCTLRRGSLSIHPAARGTLADIAPTILWLLGIEQPNDMTGKRLLN
jgi:2,3-bisphosphoglycerate-independent phosphoglycerate mutase